MSPCFYDDVMLVSSPKTKDKPCFSWRASVDQKPHSLGSRLICQDFFPQWVPQGGPLFSPGLVGTLHHPNPLESWHGSLGPSSCHPPLFIPRPAIDEHEASSTTNDVKICGFTVLKPLAGLSLSIERLTVKGPEDSGFQNKINIYSVRTRGQCGEVEGRGQHCGDSKRSEYKPVTVKLEMKSISRIWIDDLALNE